MQIVDQPLRTGTIDRPIRTVAILDCRSSTIQLLTSFNGKGLTKAREEVGRKCKGEREGICIEVPGVAASSAAPRSRRSLIIWKQSSPFFPE